ncbi:ovochymase-2-like [Phlebotomus argentipes]|uniref:ovochymase-2-like n=1 Tax=Phlebotomus argentipes TaxID=94469 RepID=UPI002892EC24|nr:ovochymase-2-like [Phlebotomus argentipes]
MKVFFLCCISLSVILTVNCCDEFSENSETIRDFPFMAGLQYDGEYLCSAAILTKYLAATTAKCIYQRPYVKFTMTVGSVSSHDCGHSHAILDHDYHPKFDTRTLEYNVGVVFFDNIEFSVNVRPLNWDEPLIPVKELGNLTIVGWPLVNYTEESILASKQSLPVHITTCREVYENTPFVHSLSQKRMMCTKPFLEDFFQLQDTYCLPTEGSFLISSNEYIGIGIASTVETCPKLNSPVAFTVIQSFSIKKFFKDMVYMYKDRVSFNMNRSSGNLPENVKVSELAKI